mmetsp:Transcript_102522/g.328468  ORF Transcript_102522/g.328468 Transcript_102522/m.328468 type:complete len:311 (+) Transcript_102522:1461-2393(+)
MEGCLKTPFLLLVAMGLVQRQLELVNIRKKLMQDLSPQQPEALVEQICGRPCAVATHDIDIFIKWVVGCRHFNPAQRTSQVEHLDQHFLKLDPDLRCIRDVQLSACSRPITTTAQRGVRVVIPFLAFEILQPRLTILRILPRIAEPGARQCLHPGPTDRQQRLHDRDQTVLGKLHFPPFPKGLFLQAIQFENYGFHAVSLLLPKQTIASEHRLQVCAIEENLQRGICHREGRPPRFHGEVSIRSFLMHQGSCLEPKHCVTLPLQQLHDRIAAWSASFVQQTPTFALMQEISYISIRIVAPVLLHLPRALR